MKKIFSNSEIKSEEQFFLILKKKKIVVYVPDSHIENVFSAMSDAGAGIIGDYNKCSFRIAGIGTFKPKNVTNPFSGKKNMINFENEIRIEMECNSKNLNRVVTAMLKAHPYEESAYEIYDFVKFEKNVSGCVIELNRKTKLKVILNKLNINFKSEKNLTDSTIKRIVITENLFTDKIRESAEYFDSDLVLICRNNKYKLFNLLQ